MIPEGRILALIPARAGSERLPGKNIKYLAGRPMISWSITAAFDSKFIDDVVVSTDDERIGEVAVAAGAEIPFLRPAPLAGSTSPTVDVAHHALTELGRQGRHYNYMALLQPTSPLRAGKHIDQAVELLREKSADAVLSVTKSDHPEEWAKELLDDLSMHNFTGPEFIKRSQDLPVRYRVNGAIYLINVARFLKERTFFLKDKVFALCMDPEYSIDVDSWMHFRIADMFLRETVRRI